MNTKMMIIIIITAILAFWLGIKAHGFYYNDICLDLGGGQNPGNHHICVIQQ